MLELIIVFASSLPVHRDCDHASLLQVLGGTPQLWKLSQRLTVHQHHLGPRAEAQGLPSHPGSFWAGCVWWRIPVILCTGAYRNPWNWWPQRKKGDSCLWGRVYRTFVTITILDGFIYSLGGYEASQCYKPETNQSSHRFTFVVASMGTNAWSPVSTTAQRPGSGQWSPPWPAIAVETSLHMQIVCLQ